MIDPTDGMRESAMKYLEDIGGWDDPENLTDFDIFAHGMAHAATLIEAMYQRQGRPISAAVIARGDWLKSR